jgi:hypothetical protein
MVYFLLGVIVHYEHEKRDASRSIYDPRLLGGNRGDRSLAETPEELRPEIVTSLVT